MTYFELYEIPESLHVDAAFAKKKFLELSRKFHPDFHGGASEEKQQEVLEYSTMNTNAFNTFKTKVKTIEYVLSTHDLLQEGYQLAPDFLMEMMEINEELMEMEFDFNAANLVKVEESVRTVKDELEQELASNVSAFESITDESEKLKLLEKVKEYYYKNKYLVRIEGVVLKMKS